MQEGKKIRRKTWSKSSYWKLKGNILMDSRGIALDDWEVIDDELQAYELLHELINGAIKRWENTKDE